MKTILRILLAASAIFAAPLRSADVPISGLPAISSVGSTTIIPVVDVSGTPTTKKAIVSQLITGLPAASSSADGKMLAADKAKLDASTDSNTASAIVRRDSSGNFAANNITANAVLGLASPVSSTDAANKAYVDAAAAGLSVKTPARGATTGSNITLSGGAPSTLDGLTLVANDRILVKDQSTQTQNGIYFVQTLGTGANGTWARTTDADTGAELVAGSYIFVTAGTTNGGSSWVMTTPNPITIGTSNIVWFLYNQITNVPASAITGQIINSQIANLAISTAKFASGITPVEIVSSLPISGNFTGRTVYLTSDSQLYRFNGSSFTAAVPTTGLTGTITSTQISDNSISTPKLQANSVTAVNIGAGEVKAGKLDVNAVTAGTIAAGAVNTTELHVGAVTGTNIAGGTITTANIGVGQIVASLINVSNLSAINANMGTITAGSLTASSSVSVGSGTGQVSISSSGLVIAGGRITMAGDGTNPYMRVYGTGGSFSNSRIEINGLNGAAPATIFAVDNGGSTGVNINSNGVFLANSAPVSLGSGSRLKKTSSDSWGPLYNDGNHDLEFQWNGSDLKLRVDQTTVYTVTTTP